jgi:hypothetical protein
MEKLEVKCLANAMLQLDIPAFNVEGEKNSILALPSKFIL